MLNLLKSFTFIAAFIWLNTGNANPDQTIRDSQSSLKQIQSEQDKNSDNNAQVQIEVAAEHFDAFALLIPRVLNAKLQSFYKHGFKAILLEDPETKPAEEQMIGSLVKGLQALGVSLEIDLATTQAHQIKRQSSKQSN